VDILDLKGISGQLLLLITHRGTEIKKNDSVK